MSELTEEIQRCRAKKRELNHELQESLSSFIAGSYRQLEDEHLADMATALSAWITHQATTHLNSQTITALLLMEYWGADAERISRYTIFTSSKLLEMIEQLQESKLLSNNELKHPWYDAAGVQLHCEIAIYAAVMLGKFRFVPGQPDPQAVDLINPEDPKIE